MPAPRGMARQHHLRGVILNIVPANKVLFAGTVLANNLFQYIIQVSGQTNYYYLGGIFHGRQNNEFFPKQNK